MKLIPDLPELPKWALDALDPQPFAETDRADMGTAFGLDASMAPPVVLTPEEIAQRDALAAENPLVRRLDRRNGL
jgi:hypothetical protein